MEITTTTNQTTEETSTTNQANSTVSSNESSVVLLGFSDYETTNTTSFSFFIYFVPILNTIYSKFLRFPITVIYNTALRRLDTSTESVCSLQDSSETKLQYKCEAEATDTSNIDQIKIDLNFKFDDPNIKLSGITSLANSYMNKIQDSDDLNYLANSEISILDHSLYSETGINSFNISGVMNSDVDFGDDEFILQINSNSSGTNKEINATCSITEIKNQNYTLSCISEEEITQDDLQSAFSKIDDSNVLLVNFDTSDEASSDDNDETDVSNSRRFIPKSSNGLNAGGIVAIVLASVVAAAAVVGVIILQSKGNTPNADMKTYDSSNQNFKA